MYPFPARQPSPVSINRLAKAVMTLVRINDWPTAEFLTRNYQLREQAFVKPTAFIRRLRVAAREYFKELSESAMSPDIPTERLLTLAWIACAIYNMRCAADRLYAVCDARSETESQPTTNLSHSPGDFQNWTNVHTAIEASRVTGSLGQREASLENIDQILRQAPDELWSLGVRAKAFRALRRHDDAFADFEKFFDRMAESNLGYVLLASGSPVAFFPCTTIGLCDAIVRATETEFAEDGGMRSDVKIVAYQGEHMVTVWELTTNPALVASTH